MAEKPLNVLFVCERNSIRSVMAEALLNRFADGRFRAFSADLNPATELHPIAAEMLKASGLATANLKPRHVSEFMAPGAPRMDFVIGIGNDFKMRGLPGNPMVVRWGISEPLSGDGDLIGTKLAFRRAFRELENRIRLFVLVRHNRESDRTVEGPSAAQA